MIDCHEDDPMTDAAELRGLVQLLADVLDGVHAEYGGVTNHRLGGDDAACFKLAAHLVAEAVSMLSARGFDGSTPVEPPAGYDSDEEPS